MSYINFESARDKEKARNELRAAREEMLKEAESRAKKREDREHAKHLRGDSSFLLPAVEKKLKKMSKEKKKKKRSSKKKNKRSSSDSEEDQKRKKKKKRKPSSSSSSSSGSEDEWVEKVGAAVSDKPLERDDWMANLLLPTFQKEKKEPTKKDPSKQIDAYDPGKSSRELNPHWKDGGSGLPSFQRPKEDDDDYSGAQPKYSSSRGNWKKKDLSASVTESAGPSKEIESSSSSAEEVEEQPTRTNFLTDAQMNELGAKIVKAEIMGNDELAQELKTKLELAREERKNVTVKAKSATAGKSQTEEIIILTKTNAAGMKKPLEATKTEKRSRKKNKVDTHVSGERVRYFPDDDKYDIKSMFEKEKFTTASDSDAQFARIAAAANKSRDADNLEDIFSEHANRSAAGDDERERQAAINEHQKTVRMLENCEYCIDSTKMEKQLMIALGNKAYLALPWHEGLQTGHCIIATTHHVSCSTQLDEEVWDEITQFRKALTRMFASRKQDVIFFEIAKNLHRRPHIVIHCVPSRNFELAPMYFKKAIQESEREWAMNKQLVDLRKERKDVRRAIPKTLPYFWVNFGMDEGFAHVIEEQERFPMNFAQEVIGGMLNLDARVYRKPRREHNPIPKVRQFADWWKHYDFTRDQ